MLRSLAIRDVVLIDRLELEFHPHLNVLTGETGAGKSILLDALGLALGARADAALVRQTAAGSGAGGEDARAVVTAAFAPPADHPVRALVAGHGIAVSPGEEIVLRRIVTADGRSRAFVNDQPVGVTLLRAIGDSLVEIEGQFAAQRLTDAAAQRDALDAYGGLGFQASAVAEGWQGWRDAEAAAAEAAAARDRAVAEEELLRHTADELRALDARPGEEDALAGERALLGHAEKLIEALNTAQGFLADGDGVESAVRRAVRALDRASDRAAGRFDAAIAALDRALVALGEATATIEEAGGALDLDPRRLEAAEARLFALRAMARKHRVTTDDLPALLARASAELGAIEAGGTKVSTLHAAAAEARERYRSAAEALSAARVKAAKALGKAVGAELAPLKLDKARFRVAVEPQEESAWGSAGMDRVRFEVATNPGAPFGAVGRIASGGELARFTLALKVALASVGSAPTLVFDEVDAGIGGATAAAVGERLAALARSVQVLVVTHSPQVAARGTHHWRVAKGDVAGSAVTRVDALPPGERLEEIARMLSGARVTAEARAAAAQLIGGDGR